MKQLTLALFLFLLYENEPVPEEGGTAKFIIDDRNLEDITVEVFKVTSKIPSYNIDLNTIAKNDEN